jgi:hypothetical protein
MFVSQYHEYSRSRRPRTSYFWKSHRSLMGISQFVGRSGLLEQQYGDHVRLFGLIFCWPWDSIGRYAFVSQWWSFVFCIHAQKEPLVESPGIADYVVPAVIWHISVDLSHGACHNRSVVNCPLTCALCCDEWTRTQETVSLSKHISLFTILFSHVIILVFTSFQK